MRGAGIVIRLVLLTTMLVIIVIVLLVLDLGAIYGSRARLGRSGAFLRSDSPYRVTYPRDGSIAHLIGRGREVRIVEPASLPDGPESKVRWRQVNSGTPGTAPPPANRGSLGRTS